MQFEQWTDIMDPSAFLAKIPKISAPITQEKSDIISNVRSLYVEPDGDQAPGVESDGPVMDIEWD